MAGMKVLIQKVSGNGILSDEPVAAYEEVNAAALPGLQAKHSVAYGGGILDFVSVDAARKLANQTEPLTDADVDSLQTCWKGEPLPVGTLYALITGHDPNTEVAEFLSFHFKKAFESERFVQAQGSQAFSAGAAAQKNVGQAAKPTGGVWGQKRQGPPRF